MVDVDIARDKQGRERPADFRAGQHEYRVHEHLDTWYGVEDTWYKVRAHDGNLYILRQSGENWRLESFRQDAPEDRQIA